MVAVIVFEGALRWMIVITVIGVMSVVYRKGDILGWAVLLATLITVYVTLIRYMPVIKDSVVF